MKQNRVATKRLRLLPEIALHHRMQPAMTIRSFDAEANIELFKGREHDVVHWTDVVCPVLSFVFLV